jgi:pimeloyl-ACP methyl ester carboxylesterase
MPGQPLILVVHGSGPKNSADEYAYFLHEYLVRVSYLEKFYIVAIDCPGYSRSKGSKEAVKTFPLKMFKEILQGLGYRNYFAMMGHSQGGAAIFNAVHEEPTLT